MPETREITVYQFDGLSDAAGKCVLYIAHIQRSIGADVERHT